jgi:hypothetical protein
MMQAVRLSETSVNYSTTRHHIPEDSTRQEQTFIFTRLWRKSFTSFTGEGRSSSKKSGNPFTEVGTELQARICAILAQGTKVTLFTEYWLKERLFELILNFSALMMVIDRLAEAKQ